MLTPLVERSALESPLLEAAVAASPLHTAERVRESVCVQRGGCVCQQWSDGYCKLRGYTLVYKQQGTLHISQAVPPASTKYAQLPPTTIPALSTHTCTSSKSLHSPACSMAATVSALSSTNRVRPATTPWLSLASAASPELPLPLLDRDITLTLLQRFVRCWTGR